MSHSIGGRPLGVDPLSWPFIHEIHPGEMSRCEDARCIEAVAANRADREVNAVIQGDSRPELTDERIKGTSESAQISKPTSDIDHTAAGMPARGAQDVHKGLIGRCPDPRCIAYWNKAFPIQIKDSGVRGVGPDAPTETLANGAKQSRTAYAMTSIDPHALLALAAVHQQGDIKYGKDNWRGVSVDSHINHALIHLTAWLAGDRSDDHLAHALCRIEMALALDLQARREDEQQ